MNVPSGDYDIVQGPTPYDHLTRQYMTLENTYNIRVLPRIEVTIHYKNINCYDQSDKIGFKVFNYDERPNTTQNEIDGWPWIISTLNNGCVDRLSSGNILAGHYIYTWEATRNGITETGIDTFYVAPGANDVIEMFW